MNKRPNRVLRLASLAALAPMLLLSGLFSVLPALADATTEVETRLLENIKYLASDELEGRGVGTQGLNEAAEFIRKEFAAAGLDVTRVDGGAFQTFSMGIGAELLSPNTLQFVDAEGNSLTLEHGKDFQTCSFGGAGKFEGEIVFGGYAIDAPDEEYQDFKGVDLKGKVVIIMRRVPRQSNPHGPFSGGPHGGISRHAELRSKVSNAFGAGAAAVLFVNDPHSSRESAEETQAAIEKAEQRVIEAAEKFAASQGSDAGAEAAESSRTELIRRVKQLGDARKAALSAKHDELMEFGYGGRSKLGSIPIMHITQESCDKLLKSGLGRTLAELEAEIDSDLKPRTATLKGWTVQGQTSLRQVEAEIKNVIGVLEGEGPHADETVVIGAHYDHVGRGGEGSLLPGSKEIHNGADDNASGTVALLEIARRVASRPEKPARRIVFIAFTAEESGLIGSAHYCKNPVFPLEKTVAMLNMDMVGRLSDDQLTIFGVGTSPFWKEVLETSGQKQGFQLSLKPEGFGPSDQSSFYAKKIPVLHFFTGTHPDYHRPTDDWEKINIPGMRKVVEMVEEVLLATVSAPKAPEYVEVKQRANPTRGGNRPYFGSIPDFGGDAPGYNISGVAPGSPADKGGLKGGDSIIGLGDQKIGSLDDFDLALRKFTAGDEVEVTALRDGKEVKLKVILTAPR